MFIFGTEKNIIIRQHANPIKCYSQYVNNFKDQSVVTHTPFNDAVNNWEKCSVKSLRTVV